MFVAVIGVFVCRTSVPAAFFVLSFSRDACQVRVSDFERMSSRKTSVFQVVLILFQLCRPLKGLPLYYLDSGTLACSAGCWLLMYR